MDDLNNQNIIDQTLTMHISEAEILYWKLEDALSDGDRQTANTAFHLLLYAAKYKPELISKGLRSKQRERMKEICNEMNGNSNVRIIKPI